MKEKLTFTQTVEMFRKHWNTIADMTPEEMKECGHVEDIKRRALHKMEIDEIIYMNCFCCEYSEMMCHICPIKWAGCVSRCVGFNGEYALFSEAINNEEYGQAAEIAREIANLPAREMMEGEE